jgi:hypothetical protein
MFKGALAQGGKKKLIGFGESTITVPIVGEKKTYRTF